MFALRKKMRRTEGRICLLFEKRGELRVGYPGPVGERMRKLEEDKTSGLQHTVPLWRRIAVT